jgi:putative transposase
MWYRSRMARGPRLDVAGALYHVIARGVERRAIFRDDVDRERFVERLARLVGEEAVGLYAYVLLDNHFHLVVRRGPRPLSQLMRRLLTGHSVVFNRRHRRVGHLFQNRYQAVLCDHDAYLLQLVRYLHLNPVRAQIVGDPAQYRWSSHQAYLGRRPPEWLAVEVVLEQVGGRAAYRQFIADGAGEGKRLDLIGTKAASLAAAGTEGPRQLWLGSQVLGDARFARAMVRRGRQREAEREMHRGRADELPALATKVAKGHGVSMAGLRGRGRPPQVSAARRALVRAAVVERGIRPVDVSRFLGIATASVAAHLRAIDAEPI